MFSGYGDQNPGDGNAFNSGNDNFNKNNNKNNKYNKGKKGQHKHYFKDQNSQNNLKPPPGLG